MFYHDGIAFTLNDNYLLLLIVRGVWCIMLEFTTVSIRCVGA